ncbi:MAG: hypothetical protein JXX29_01005 [Deltaproteobacteria bacterium]|nr:hypothetical protein [Deltaproteobacteria bacterium]MBN2670217.1 hypothetical protein [Deltaproteobacteria bacterium]
MTIHCKKGNLVTSWLLAAGLLLNSQIVLAQDDETAEATATDAQAEESSDEDAAGSASDDETDANAEAQNADAAAPTAEKIEVKEKNEVKVTPLPTAPAENATQPQVVSQAGDPEAVSPQHDFDISEYVGYDGGFFLNDKGGIYSLKVNARMQAKYTFEAVDTGDDDKEIESNFSIPAARIKLKGHVVSKAVSYALQLDFGKGNALLKDFYADFAFVKNAFHLRVGQWVKPFSRQQITSSGKLEFTGRAMTDKAFGAGRDIGLAFHNNYEKSPGFEWALGVFNGTGEKPWFEGDAELDDTSDEYGEVSGKFTNVPDTFNPMAVARIGFNTGELKGYSEADLEGGAPRFGLGVSGIFDFDADDSDDGEIRGELDYILKVHGFSSTGGIYLMSVQNGTSFGDQTYGAIGMHAQIGYVIKGMVQPVFRYGTINPDGGDLYRQEITGGISLYFAKHNLKWQTEFGALLEKDGDDDTADTIVATQLQLAF